MREAGADIKATADIMGHTEVELTLNLNHDIYYIGEPTTKITGYIFLCPAFFAL